VGFFYFKKMKILVLITTYNRPDLLVKLLTDIKENSEDFEIKLLICNDGSSSDYRVVLNYLRKHFLNNFHYIPSLTNGGKQNYWTLIDKLYKQALKIKFDYAIQLPDDVSLVPGFFSRAINIYDKIEDNKKVCLDILSSPGRVGKSEWTNQEVTTHLAGNIPVYKTGWVDMCFISDKKYFEALNYTINKVNDRWVNKLNNSSGVGKQISTRLVTSGYSLYQVKNSLVIHGSHDSVMHRNLRKTSPLITNHNGIFKNKITYRNDITELFSHNDHIGKQLQNGKVFYEQPMLDYIQNQNIRGTYIDAGSNIGNHAVFFAKYCTDKVIAIEPVPSNFKILQDNIRNNNLNDKIEALKYAITLSEGEYSFNEFPDNMGMCAIVPGKGVKSIKLDSLDIQGRIGLLKIDCERMDFDVLQSASNLISRDKPHIFIEAQDLDLLSQIKDFLGPLGYVIKARFNSTPTYHFQYVLDKITANMATIPERVDVLPNVVKSIIDQVDELNVYLNGFTDLPKCLLHYKIKVFWSQRENGDLGDAGKFYRVGKTKGYFITIDDDLIYPRDYIQKTIAAIEAYDRKAIISFHGRVLKGVKILNYYSRSSLETYRCLNYVNGDHPVHIGGTGVMGFHYSAIKLDISDFEIPNMADVWLAKKAQMQEIPIMVIGHESEWIKHAPIDLNKTIAHTMKNNSETVTNIVNSINWKIMKANRKIDVIIPFIATKGKFDELKYALRSIEQNLDADFRVVIIGDCPEWINRENVNFIAHKRDDAAVLTNCYDANNKMNQLLTNSEIGDDFILTYDDIYFLKKTSIDDIKKFYAIKNGGDSTASSTWKQLLNNTFARLKSKNLTQFNFETHLPRFINKKKMIEVYQLFRPIRHRLLHFTLYYNYHLQDNFPVCISKENGQFPAIKAGFYGVDDDFSLDGNKSPSELIEMLINYQFLNHDDAGLSDSLVKIIKKLFPNKSRFEL
jgi:FkbM family methyltransferase